MILILLECPEGSMTCGNGMCVENSHICDGLEDCDDGLDEVKHCGKTFSTTTMTSLRLGS